MLTFFQHVKVTQQMTAMPLHVPKTQKFGLMTFKRDLDNITGGEPQFKIHNFIILFFSWLISALLTIKYTSYHVSLIIQLTELSC